MIRHLCFTALFAFFYTTLFSQKTYIKFGFDEKNGDVVTKENAVFLPFDGKHIVYDTVFQFSSSYTSRDILKGIKKMFASFAKTPALGISAFEIVELRGYANKIIYEDLDDGIITGYLAFITPKEKGRPKLVSFGDLIVCKTTFLVKDNRVKIFIEDVEFYYGNLGRRILGETLGGTAVGLLASLTFDSFNQMMEARMKISTNDYQIPYNEGVAAYSTDYYIRKLPEALKEMINSEIIAKSKYKMN